MFLIFPSGIGQEQLNSNYNSRSLDEVIESYQLPIRMNYFLS